ncbi:iron (metal) dependent repressor, DtxR family [Brevibacterium sp. Mu109]|uniref:metal-dependent transcriptional regulator n=1 Tax=Brevibacterium sp. Mu109 TaxID=1255669 RepID=UPI000C6972B4|nr:metal-dependent transcriptional regulator [Brevibacterium sp. Mu109]SMY00949.1 iron (metal) dependent repressor, DtxR family [Brevibacterium sp. Mu109]
MSVADLSASTQNYLKAIWSLQEWSDDPVTASAVAQKTGLKISTVSGAMPKLGEQGLVEYARYGDISLTAAGQEYAVAMVRRHRLIETFLVEILGYRWDEVHNEAEVLEHAVSDVMIERLDELLAHPIKDPHGDPIPSPSGTVERAPFVENLSEARPGVRMVVDRISDDDPELLRFFADRGLVVGAELTVSAGPPYSDSLQVQVEGSSSFVLGRAATDAVWVCPMGQPTVS